MKVMNPILNLSSVRAKKARWAVSFGEGRERFLEVADILLGLLALGLLVLSGLDRLGWFLLAVAIALLMFGIWYRRDLKVLPAGKGDSLDDLMEPELLGLLPSGKALNSKMVFDLAGGSWQTRFICQHLLLTQAEISQLLPNNPAGMPKYWQAAKEMAAKEQLAQIPVGSLVAALLINTPAVQDHLMKLNLKPEDVESVHAWLARLLKAFKTAKPYFGGVGRDWAAGFTPTLDHFGVNISRQVESGLGQFATRAHGEVLDSVVHNLSMSTGNVAVIGPAGTGKTSLVYALAERLLQGRDTNLLYYQVISLNAASILSASKDNLEKIMLTLFNEAVHAHNIIIFLDEAQLFFGHGTGALDISQILLPLLEHDRVKVIAAFTPDDYQTLKSQNSSLAGHLNPVNLTEPSAEITIKVLEDTALSIEQEAKVLISYQAIKQAYTLSDQYIQDQAYPGKAIGVLRQALPYAREQIMTAESIQEAIELTRGVRIARAEAPEADILLHLEDKIHQRMINQESAVKVVAAALRRGRAGVADPNRPIGSFLFLGPTGVGKTELARSLAATYFGDARRMIRLDMSEYQQPSDVERLLGAGSNSEKSLILAVREQPFSVVLLDEVEKAHPNILNLLLQVLDEGRLSDQAGKPASFRNAIIIATSNAGSADITSRVASGDTLQQFERPLVDKLISQGTFKAELINRFDEVVLFRPLNQGELSQVAQLMLAEVNKILSKQNISVKLTEAALKKLVSAGYDPQFGARPMRRVIQSTVEDAVATRILEGKANPGTAIVLDVKDL